MIRVFCLVLAMLAASALTVRAQTDPLPLIDAAEMADQRHVILTVALTDETRGATHAQDLAADLGVELAAIWPLASIDVACYVFQVPDGIDPGAFSDQLLARDDVLTAHPVNQFDLMTTAYRDDLFPIQHALHDLGAAQAHDLTTGAGVRLAVIDSGVSTAHVDLAQQNILWRDFVRVAPDGEIGEAHGTAIAAIIAADAGNGVGMIGVSPGVDLLALRACWAQDAGASCNSFSLARAINFALLNDADILNLSLGGPYDPLMDRLITAAVNRGLVLVAAHGPNEAPQFPASHDGVISVRENGVSADGPVTAPGHDVLSAKPDGTFDFFSGSSVATAHVSGVIALLLAQAEGADPSIGSALDAGMVDTPHGRRLNACHALRHLGDYDLVCS